MKNTKAFTLMELMVVILIVGVLAAASVPLMRGRVESAKWAEAHAAAGTIRSAVRVRFAEVGNSDGLVGALSSNARRTALGFTEEDLKGTYFSAADYRVMSVDSNGIATVRVTGNQPNAPTGTRTLSADGSWK